MSIHPFPDFTYRWSGLRARQREAGEVQEALWGQGVEGSEGDWEWSWQMPSPTPLSSWEGEELTGAGKEEVRPAALWSECASSLCDTGWQ